MIIHHTRTNLLLLKEKSVSIVNSIEILKARRQALIREFLDVTRPFLRTRRDIVQTYGRSLDELAMSLGNMGRRGLESVTYAAKRDMKVDIRERSIWGLKYRDVVVHEKPVRNADMRGYGIMTTSSHLEECIYLFEKILESMLEIAAYESKLKRLSEEITRVTRKIKVIEERILPGLKFQIKTISEYISERERENFFRLKKFKQLHRSDE
jgi:V/A-type H+/Na+-transporting ATPase subunit D